MRHALIALILAAASGFACKPKDGSSQAKTELAKTDTDCLLDRVNTMVFEASDAGKKATLTLAFNSDKVVTEMDDQRGPGKEYFYRIGRPAAVEKCMIEIDTYDAATGKPLVYRSFTIPNYKDRKSAAYLAETSPPPALPQGVSRSYTLKKDAQGRPVRANPPTGKLVAPPVTSGSAARDAATFVNPELWLESDIKSGSVPPCSRLVPADLPGKPFNATEVQSSDKWKSALRTLMRGQPRRPSDTLSPTFSVWMVGNDGQMAAFETETFTRLSAPPPGGAYLPCLTNPGVDESYRAVVWERKSRWFAKEAQTACLDGSKPAGLAAGRPPVQGEIAADSLKIVMNFNFDQLANASQREPLAFWVPVAPGQTQLKRVVVNGVLDGAPATIADAPGAELSAHVICLIADGSGSQEAFKFADQQDL
jgi:hypothetical protein